PLDVPTAPVEIQRLLAQAPPGPWDRLDYVRHQLLDHVVATGAGSPQQITPARVVDLLRGSKKGSPFEIVAAEALLARWAGIPSRIGLGSTGVDEENGVRAVLLRVLPFLLALLTGMLATPALAKLVRRRRRERWAEALGPRARIAVAYAELRDAATDLSLGDPFATAIEFLDRVQEDGEHRELAWLVTRAIYGDLAYDTTEEDAKLAEEMASSLVRRLRAAQPLQVRMVAGLS